MILSAGVYFDVMPKGIAKGPTLLRFIETLYLDPGNVLVAGDTLNDLSLFETGLDGVAVGNSEPDLVARIRDPRERPTFRACPAAPASPMPFAVSVRPWRTDGMKNRAWSSSTTASPMKKSSSTAKTQ